MRRLKTTFLFWLCASLAVVIMISTNPRDISSVSLLLLPPLLFFIALTGVSYRILESLNIFRNPNARNKLVVFSLICSGLPILLIILKSIDQLSVRDAVLTGSLVFVLTFYFSRTSLNNHNS